MGSHSHIKFVGSNLQEQHSQESSLQPSLLKLTLIKTSFTMDNYELRPNLSFAQTREKRSRRQQLLRKAHRQRRSCSPNEATKYRQTNSTSSACSSNQKTNYFTVLCEVFEESPKGEIIADKHVKVLTNHGIGERRILRTMALSMMLTQLLLKITECTGQRLNSAYFLESKDLLYIFQRPCIQISSCATLLTC